MLPSDIFLLKKNQHGIRNRQSLLTGMQHHEKARREIGLLTDPNELMSEVRALIKASKRSQKEVAEKLGISQPKVSMLISGKLSAFSLVA